jgi:hypothetical protein
VIRNETAEPVNFALRRVQRKIRVKLQEMGPRLVWQLYLCQPDRDLLKSRLVMFRESDPITDPTQLPNAPPKPKPVDETGMATGKPVSGTLTLRLPKYQDFRGHADAAHTVSPRKRACAAEPQGQKAAEGACRQGGSRPEQGVDPQVADLDYEQWSNNPGGKHAFLQTIIQDIEPACCIFLSGEVHFGLTGGVDYYITPPMKGCLGRQGKVLCRQSLRPVRSTHVKSAEERSGERRQVADEEGLDRCAMGRQPREVDAVRAFRRHLFGRRRR